MARPTRSLIALILVLSAARLHADDSAIPKPEHPRPDAMRAQWFNLNGSWDFRFDPKDQGTGEQWQNPGAQGFDRKITVPFPWESELSGIHQVKDAPKVGWYRRSFKVPDMFPATDHVWLRFGAVDWHADVWVNGQKVASHDGGYTPFEADITQALKKNAENVVVVRAFDPTDPSLPTGKQVGWYTPSSGIWQTVWLESRPAAYVSHFRIITTIDPPRVRFRVNAANIPQGQKFQIRTECRHFEEGVPFSATTPLEIHNGTATTELTLDVLEPKLWTPESPHIYDATIQLQDQTGKTIDSVQTYFGVRTIAHGKYGDEPFERILLNGKPIYLRTALDQSFNPKGLYTAPDDDFLKRDLVIAKSMGLNGLRIHIKPDEPRKLFWADRYGLLILEDMPNTWEQNPKARAAWEATMREAIARDANHPAIIAWVAFNETWGLGSPDKYKKDKDTQNWVAKMVEAIRALDPTRLVEDNSPCNFDHITQNDINSWHFYIDNHDEARRHIEDVVNRTKPGSDFNLCPGLTQSTLPLINSEYGSISAGSGDRDISWGLRDLTTQLRRHKKIQGFVYTELSDIEWEHNGFVNYDRSPKFFGYDAWVPEMQPAELMGADFIGYDTPPVIVGKPGQTITIPIFVSHYSDRTHPVKVRWWASGYDARANIISVSEPKNIAIEWKPYDVTELAPLTLTLPNFPLVGAVAITLRDQDNRRFAANFVNIVVKPDRPLPRIERRGQNDLIVRFSPGEFSSQKWSHPPKVQPGKVSGLGAGYFEYQFRLPAIIARSYPESIYFTIVAGAKADRQRLDWPERTNREDYPQTDPSRPFPSTLTISLNGKPRERITLADDAADARGVLSHLAAVDHGSHGELVDGLIKLSNEDRAALAAGAPITLRLAVPSDSPKLGGLTIFGASTGEMPIDPTLEIHFREPLPHDLGVNPNQPITGPKGP
jgi:hypothetical protein